MDGTEVSGTTSSDSSGLKSYARSTNFWLTSSLIVMVLCIVWFFYTTHQQSLHIPKPIPIVSSPAVSRNVPIFLSALGSVTPTNTVSVKAQVAGVLQEVFFKEGQLVKAGDNLAQIDPRPYQALLMQYQGNLKRDKALLANARTDLKRYKRLWRQDSVSQQTLVTQQSLVEQYEGVVRSDEGLIESTKISLNYCLIKAPVNGRIGLRLVDKGNFIQLSALTGLAVINTVNPITVIFSLPEDDIPQVAPYVYADESLKVYAYDRQMNHLLAKGSLLTMDNQINSATGTVRLKAVFDNKNNRLFPNQFVNIKILVDILSQAILIPTEAIQHTLNSNYVYVLEGDRATIKTVIIGPTLGAQTVIKKGLISGQLVVIEGADKLVNGAHIIDEKPVKQQSKTRASRVHAKLNHPPILANIAFKSLFYFYLL
jgi:multidrug efflux system membrane fusion protein